MKQNELIITHPGSAHFDEVTAISLLLASRSEIGFKIERREPAPSEIADPGIWVIDIGNSYEPALRNFDHHQSVDCPASFVLLARYFGLEKLFAGFPWWEFKNSVDRFGPVRASALFGAGDDMVNRNPVENWFIDRFASDTAELLPSLKSFGLYLIEDARRLNSRIEFWKSCPTQVIKGIKVLIGDTPMSYGLEEFQRLVSEPPQVVISKDGRGAGWRLFRYEGAPVDFNRISSEPEIEFVHKTGFLAKARAGVPLERALELVKRSIIN